VAALERAKRGDDSSVPTLLSFLERSPYSLFSGYLKSDVAMAMRRFVSDPQTANRLRDVVINAVHGPTVREFKAYTQLARTLDSPEFRLDLQRAMASTVELTTIHARWILNGMGPAPDQTARATGPANRTPRRQ
jgi:hypothetical protein